MTHRVMYVVQKITKIDYDGNEKELVPIEGKFDREAFLEQTINIETDKTMLIFMSDVEYCGEYIFRRFSDHHEYTYCEKDCEWTEDIKGEMKVKDILEKLKIKPYDFYDDGRVGGPIISYPISIKFKNTTTPFTDNNEISNDSLNCKLLTCCGFI